MLMMRLGHAPDSSSLRLTRNDRSLRCRLNQNLCLPAQTDICVFLEYERGLLMREPPFVTHLRLFVHFQLLELYILVVAGNVVVVLLRAAPTLDAARRSDTLRDLVQARVELPVRHPVN